MSDPSAIIKLPKKKEVKMTTQELKSRYRELMNLAQFGDFFSNTEFDELMAISKKLGIV
jgi:hypothetical protein